jgi:hypothetical protein
MDNPNKLNENVGQNINSTLNIFKVELSCGTFEPVVETIHATGCGLNAGVLLFYIDSPDKIVQMYNQTQWKSNSLVLPKGQGNTELNTKDFPFLSNSRSDLN